MDGFDHHDHAGTATEGVVIQTLVFVRAERAQVVHHHFGQAFLLRTLEDALVEVAVQQAGQRGKDVDAHEAGGFEEPKSGEQMAAN
jgi:hypothetical protein